MVEAKKRMVISVGVSKRLNIRNPAVGASVVNAQMGNNDSIRKSELAIYCLIKVCQIFCDLKA